MVRRGNSTFVLVISLLSIAATVWAQDVPGVVINHIPASS